MTYLMLCLFVCSLGIWLALKRPHIVKNWNSGKILSKHLLTPGILFNEGHSPEATGTV
jgi:hypothetical protein